MQVIAQLAEQLGRFAELLGQDVACAVERRLDVGDALVGVDVCGGFRLRIEQRVREQCVRERLEAGFAGDLRARAALRLVRQIEIFEHLLAVGRVDRGAQLVGQLALFVDARQDRRAAILELAQIQQAFLELAQLRVVQIARHFLAVPGNERNGRAFVEELHRRRDLARLDGQFGGDALYDLECYGFRHVVDDLPG
jgi:signal transduction histidine kinase